MVEIKSYPAKNGDAFLLKAMDSSFAMLVDGGYADTFQQYIKADLKSLADSGQELSVVVATHVDADHISGLLSFFRLNGRAEAPAIIPVREVLHNSLRSLVAPAGSQTLLPPEDLALLQEIRRRGYPPPISPTDSAQEISARQGSSLAELLHAGGYRWNTQDGTLAASGDKLNALRLPNVRLMVLGPSRLRLDTLKKWWISEIRRLGVTGSLKDLDDVFEFLCAHEVVDPGVHALASSDEELAKDYFPDDSITNGSSISLLLEIEALRLLFLGDAWAEDVVTALKNDGPTVFDAIKIAHHGSARNTSLELLGLVDSPHFFISTNGEGYQHPDFAVLKAIVDRPATFSRTLHFNYSTAASRRLRTHRSKAGADFVVEEGQTNWVKLSGQNTP
jgi:hypothetical protein